MSRFTSPWLAGLLVVASLAVLATAVSLRFSRTKGEVIAPSAPYSPAPEFRLVVASEAVHDFGIVMRGSVLTHEFDIENATTETLHLRLGAVSCYCTNAKLQDNSIPPGARTRVVATVDTSDNASGSLEVSVPLVVTAEDGRTETIPLRMIIAQVSDTEGVFPATIDFGTARRGELPISKEFRISLLAKDEDDVSVAILKGPPEKLGLTVTFDKQPAKASDLCSYRGTLTLDPRKVPESLEDFASTIEFQVKKASGEFELLKINTGVVLRDFIIANPSALYWSREEKGQPITVSLHAADDGILEIVNIRCNAIPPVVSWEVVDGKSVRPKTLVKRAGKVSEAGEIIRQRLDFEVIHMVNGKSTVSVPIVIP